MCTTPPPSPGRRRDALELHADAGEDLVRGEVDARVGRRGKGMRAEVGEAILDAGGDIVGDRRFGAEACGPAASHRGVGRAGVRYLLLAESKAACAVEKEAVYGHPRPGA